MPTLTIDTDRLSALLAQALLGHGTAVDGLAALCGTLGRRLPLLTTLKPCLKSGRWCRFWMTWGVTAGWSGTG